MPWLLNEKLDANHTFGGRLVLPDDQSYSPGFRGHRPAASAGFVFLGCDLRSFTNHAVTIDQQTPNPDSRQRFARERRRLTAHQPSAAMTLHG